MNDMHRIVDAVQAYMDAYGRDPEVIVKIALNALVAATSDRAQLGSIHEQQVHRYTTAGVASILGLTS